MGRRGIGLAALAAWLAAAMAGRAGINDGQTFGSRACAAFLAELQKAQEHLDSLQGY